MFVQHVNSNIDGIPISLSRDLKPVDRVGVCSKMHLHDDVEILVGYSGAIDIRFETIANGYRLTIGDNSATFESEFQPASNPERALQTIQQQLSKLGDTHFVAQTITIIANNQECAKSFPYFIPISQLNLWRRLLTNH